MPATQPIAAGQAALAEGADERAHKPLPTDEADAARQAATAIGGGRDEAAQPGTAPAGPASVSLLAWAIVAMAFFSDALAMGGRSFFAVVLPIWETEFNWSRSYVSGAMSLVHIFQGVATPFAGHLVDVLGPRGGLTAGILYLATVLALTATVHHSWQLFLIFGVGLGIGFGLLNLNVYSAMIMQIVPESRAGTAVGIATSGSTFGQFALVPLFQHLADTYGWRTGYVVAAVATAAIAPLAWTLLTISARPTQDGGSGTAEKAKGDDGPEAGSSATDSLWVKMKRLLTNTLYWALTYAFVVCGVTTTGFVESHIIAFAEHKGMTAQDGAFAFGLLPAFNGLGILAAGWLADRYHRVYMLAAIFFVRGLCYAAMLVVSSYWQLLLFGVFFGLVDYSVVPLVISLVASYCGADVVGLGVGVLLLWHSLGAAGGSWMGGVAFDGSGHYDHAIWICLVTCVSAAAVLVLGAHGVGEPWRRRPDQDEAAASPEAAP